MGSCLLVRRAAVDQVGMFDEDFFLFSEETDWLLPLPPGGLGGAGSRRTPRPCTSAALPTAGVCTSRTCAGSCAGSPSTAARVRQPARARLLAVALRLRGLVFRGERGRMYRDAARAL